VDRRRIAHVLFDISVITKGVDGVLEVLGGALLLLVTSSQIQSGMRILTQHELSEDPHDVVATYLLNSTQHLASTTKIFAAAYLLWHGIVKVALVAALLRKKRWAYPAAILAFALFVVYQLYRYSHTRAPELLVLSIFDGFVIVLTCAEYFRLRALNALS
jgi:uncharacterized membrane protein